MNKNSFLIDKRLFIKKGIYLVSICILSLLIYFVFYSNNVSAGIADNLIRLHVVAESDTEEDQALKLEVRDAIINYMNDKLVSVKNIEESKEIIRNNISKITEIAENVVKSRGKEYPIAASLGIYPFPTKNYGDITLPPGNYQALRIVIGNGKGANWWCVLFPPLCFVDMSTGDAISKTSTSSTLASGQALAAPSSTNETLSEEDLVEVRFFLLDAVKEFFSGLFE